MCTTGQAHAHPQLLQAQTVPSYVTAGLGRATSKYAGGNPVQQQQGTKDACCPSPLKTWSYATSSSPSVCKCYTSYGSANAAPRMLHKRLRRPVCRPGSSHAHIPSQHTHTHTLACRAAHTRSCCRPIEGGTGGAMHGPHDNPLRRVRTLEHQRGSRTPPPRGDHQRRPNKQKVAQPKATTEDARLVGGLPMCRQSRSKTSLTVLQRLHQALPTLCPPAVYRLAKRRQMHQTHCAAPSIP